MKFLGVDVGTKKVGIAYSDDSGTVAFPLKVVDREDAVTQVLQVIDEKKIDAVVVGESKNLQLQDNAVMKEVLFIQKELKQRGVRIFLEPEFFSTQAAKRLGKGRDDEAAAIILQGFLDKRGKK